jgi:hypothetical protein
MEALSDFLIGKKFILEGLQGIKPIRFPRMDQVHNPKPSLSEDLYDLILLANQIPFFIRDSGEGILLWLWSIDRTLFLCGLRSFLE